MSRAPDPLLLLAGTLLLALLVTLGLHQGWRPVPAAPRARPSPVPSPLPASPLAASPSPSPSPPPSPEPSPSPAGPPGSAASPSPSPAASPSPSPKTPSPSPIASAPPPGESGPVEVPLEIPAPAPQDSPPAEAGPARGPLQVDARMLEWNADSADPGVRIRMVLHNPTAEDCTVDLAEAEFLDDYGKPLVADRQEVGRLAPGETREVWFYYVNAGRLPRVGAVLRLEYRAGETPFQVEGRLP